MNSTFYSLLLLALSMAGFTSGVFYHRGTGDDIQLNCRANVNIHYGDKLYKTSVSMSFSKGNGFIFSDGVMKLKNNEIGHLSIMQEFTYNNKLGYVAIHRTSAPELSLGPIPLSVAEGIIPNFYLDPSIKEHIVRINQVTESSWVVFGGNVPYMLCAKYGQ